jgi:hypothetical protein
MFVFGIWDLFYYVWLKVCLGWPSSLLTWDVLFLIPVPWVGPVLAPVPSSRLPFGRGSWRRLGQVPTRGVIGRRPRA